MKALLLTLGSRGDVAPFVALGQGLRAAGFEVRLATSDLFQDWVQEKGLRYAYMNSGLVKLTEDPQARAALEGSKLEALKLIGKVKPFIKRNLEEATQAAQGCDFIVYHPKALAGPSLAEALSIPGFLSMPTPFMTPTKAFSNPFLPDLKLGLLNTLSYWPNRFSTAPYQGLINAWRRGLRLPKRSVWASPVKDSAGHPIPTLYSYSSSVLPEPTDWPEHTHATGFWFVKPESYTPPESLTAFLEAGPPPVYIGFGSMAGSDPAKTTATVLEAIEQSGQRAILAKGWGGLDTAQLPESVYGLDAAPHDWLFPKMRAVVHHGGLGTTAAGLRAGKPSVLCPFYGDQPFWARRVEALGVGPKGIPKKELSAERLSAAILEATTDSAMRSKAEALGSSLRAENGVANAVKLITAYLQEARHAHAA